MTPPPSTEEWDLALDHCSLEPIHLIGQIQTGSVLIALDVKADRFTFLSANADKLLVRDEARLWDSKPSDIFGIPQLEVLAKRALSWRGRGARLVNVTLRDSDSQPGWLHLSGGQLVLELDAANGRNEPLADLLDWEDLLRESLTRVESRPDLPTKLQVVIEETAKLGGFDRVMIYRFLEDGAGEVVAECVRDDWEPYLGLRYPASDIPPQARELFFKNDIRFIRAVSGPPVELLADPASAGAQLDLSLSRYRQPAPVHLEYLKNMGVGASFVCAIVSEGALWGLISCHHGSALHLPASRQAQLAALTNHLATDIAGISREDRLRQELANTRITSKLTQCITMTDDWMSVLVSMAGELCDVLGAEGMALHFDGKVYAHGLVPPPTVLETLVYDPREEGRGEAFTILRDSNHQIAGDLLPPEIGGALVIPLSHFSHDALVFFRQERTRKIKWAGDPAKVIDHSQGVPRLRPRASFSAWQETVKGTCEPWLANDLALAGAMRLTLMDIVITAHQFRHAMESPHTARHRIVHQMDPAPFVLADESAMVVFQNAAAAGDLLLHNLQSLDLLVSRLASDFQLFIQEAVHSLVQRGEEIRIELTPQRWVEVKSLTDENRFMGYSIRIVCGVRSASTADNTHSGLTNASPA